MEKFGIITKTEKDSLMNVAKKYYKRHLSTTHPNFIEGVEYTLKHLNEIKHYTAN